MRYGSVCSGIEAATAAWHPLGWRGEFFSEIEAFPSALLSERWPGVPNLGDMTEHKLVFQTRVARNGRGAPESVVPALTGVDAGDTSDMRPVLMDSAMVRRLTPREYERLQGFPDDYTLVTFRGKPASDSARYKACGNSMAVPVMRWIGQRIQMVENLK